MNRAGSVAAGGTATREQSGSRGGGRDGIEDRPAVAAEADALAERLLELAAGLGSWKSRRQQRKSAGMIGDPEAKAFMLGLTDRVVRAATEKASGRALGDLLRRHGVPAFLGTAERLVLAAAGVAASVAPGIVIPLMVRYLRRESGDVVAPAETLAFRRVLKRRARRGAVSNVNLLGEAVLGEEEAERRFRSNLEALADPLVTHLSVKLSALHSQISMVAYDATVDVLCGRVRELYGSAVEHGVRQHGRPKSINLDMEEYRDLDLTLEVFTRVLDEREFSGLTAGVVLQAYLPDAAVRQEELAAWAERRVAGGGAPVRMRLVKGANLAMERVDASVHGWPLATFSSKADTDANFKRMLEFGVRPEVARCVHLGVGSHNLFDVAYALVLRDRFGTAGEVSVEMLAGMAEAQASAVRRAAGGLLVYTPVVRAADFPAAIAYLVRRLDENTHPDNFLHDLFALAPGSETWARQRERFLESCQRTPLVPAEPHRVQDRSAEGAAASRAAPGVETAAAGAADAFANEPDTDFALPQNRRWLAGVRDGWEPGPAAKIPIVVAGDACETADSAVGRDPSRPGRDVYRFYLGGSDHIEGALESAAEAQRRWWATGASARRRVLDRVADELSRHRGEAIGCLAVDAAKAAAEADTEVSEAVDFARYYARSLDDEGWLDGSRPEPLGTVVVCPPWNFPYAIPAGGCLAALAAGNAVVLKPAPETVLTAWVLANRFWDAGVPRDLLQFLPVPDDETGRALITDRRVGAVVLTGSSATADLFLGWRPELRLAAETSGKNAMVITASADLDLAVRDLVRSAFCHSGQKCSAVSLALVEGGVYDDPGFRDRLRDAASSLPVGPARDPAAVVTPLVQPPGPELRRGLTQLDPGEGWLLEPRRAGGSGDLWSPGVRLGVRPGSWFFETECFGPVLGLVRVRDLDEATGLQNSSRFGLTGGLQSLDPAEIARWREAVRVGNAYINRGTTGAIVRRQPFGGWKRSAFGSGAKAGGPNYVASLCRWVPGGAPPVASAPPGPAAAAVLAALESLRGRGLSPEQLGLLAAAAASDAHHWRENFSRGHDLSRVHGESNIFRYVPRPRVVLHLPEPDEFAAARVRLACAAVGVALLEPEPKPGFDPAPLLRAGDVVRAPNGCPTPLRHSAAALGVPVFDAQVVPNGRVELLHYLLEQTVSETTHRYGNVAGQSWPAAGG